MNRSRNGSSGCVRSSRRAPGAIAPVVTMLNAILRSDRGVAAIELAIIVPLMLLLMLGFTEIYMYTRAVSAVEHAAFTLADSVSQMPEIINDNSTSNANNLGALWNAAALLAAPNDLTGQGGVIITSICDRTTSPCSPSQPPPMTQSLIAGTPGIYWQARAPWTQSGMTSLETAASLLPSSWPFRNGDAAIVVEVFYRYNPFTMTSALWANAPGTQTVYERVYIRTRLPPQSQALRLVAATG